MTNDSRGYSYAFVKEIKEGDASHIGVQLGLYCIEQNIPVHEVSKALGVSRHAIYTWFRGKFTPRPAQVEKIKAFMGVASTDAPAV